MGIVLFCLWVILIAIFHDYFWEITVAIIILYLILKFTPRIIRSISERRVENKKYQTIFKGAISKVQNVNLELYQKKLSELEKLYETTYKSYKVILKDKKENIINICPKCGGYMRIVKGWKGPFLGCSNYPDCRSTRDYSEIFNLEI